MATKTHYHKTTSISLIDKYKEELKAKGEDKFISEIFKASQNDWFTPYQIQDIASANGKNIDLNNIRRSMTNLTEDGFLVKSEKPLFMGKKNKMNHGWKYNNGNLL